MQRWIMSALVSIALVGVLAATGAWAQSPHFNNASVSFDSNTGTASCTWKESGLGNNVTITYDCSADAVAIYACINGGKHNPSASNKETVSGPVDATGSFSSGKNGSITGSLTLPVPGPGGFSCPPGQTLTLGQVAYCNIDLADTTNGVDAGITPTSFSACLTTVSGVCESTLPCP